MTAPEQHLRRWLAMLDYCRAGDVDPERFAAMMQEATAAYAQMDYREQGEFHRLLAERKP